MGCARDLEHIIRLATSAHIFFSVLEHVLMYGTIGEEYTIPNKIGVKYIKLAQSMVYTFGTQKSMYLEVSNFTATFLFSLMI